ncbi:MAG: hypothetical protein PF542_00825 [Nanoarchaeota archaeon]|jgi:predicted hydrocarbon binding protein|nr:hypothetical protein [Nanoarchaeota archaeon]
MLNKKIKLDIAITIFATLISVVFILLSYIFADIYTEILSILIIILPTIYIVGNLITRSIIEQEYNNAIFDVNEGIEEMEYEIKELKEENNKLKTKH